MLSEDNSHIEIQTEIILAELNKIVRFGHNITSSKIPVIYKIILPKNNKENDIASFLLEIINNCFDKKELSINQKRALINLFGLEEDQNNDNNASHSNQSSLNYKKTYLNYIKQDKNKLDARQVTAAKILEVSNDAFQRTHREKILKIIANSISMTHEWIDENKNSSININGFPNKPINKILMNLRNILDFTSLNPHAFRIHFEYKIQIFYSKDNPNLAKVITKYTTKRIFPYNSDTFAIYIYKSFDSMMKNKINENIAGIELAELPDDLWKHISDSFDCSLIVNNQPAKTEKVVTNDKYQKILFRVENEIKEREPITIETKTVYYLSSKIRRFPVKLANHFTFNGIEINFEINGDNVKNLYYSDYFTGFDGNKPINDGLIRDNSPPPSANQRSILVIIPEETLIWPGSGIEFIWDI